jgi:hypothetical protein
MAHDRPKSRFLKVMRRLLRLEKEETKTHLTQIALSIVEGFVIIPPGRTSGDRTIAPELPFIQNENLSVSADSDRQIPSSLQEAKSRSEDLAFSFVDEDFIVVNSSNNSDKEVAASFTISRENTISQLDEDHVLISRIRSQSVDELAMPYTLCTQQGRIHLQWDQDYLDNISTILRVGEESGIHDEDEFLDNHELKNVSLKEFHSNVPTVVSRRKSLAGRRTELLLEGTYHNGLQELAHSLSEHELFTSFRVEMELLPETEQLLSKLGLPVTAVLKKDLVELPATKEYLSNLHQDMMGKADEDLALFKALEEELLTDMRGTSATTWPAFVEQVEKLSDETRSSWLETLKRDLYALSEHALSESAYREGKKIGNKEYAPL